MVKIYIEAAPQGGVIPLGARSAHLPLLYPPRADAARDIRVKGDLSMMKLVFAGCKGFVHSIKCRNMTLFGIFLLLSCCLCDIVGYIPLVIVRLILRYRVRYVVLIDGFQIIS